MLCQFAAMVTMGTATIKVLHYYYYYYYYYHINLILNVFFIHKKTECDRDRGTYM